MAIITTVSSNSSVFPDQYVRIENITTHKTKMKITVGAYFSAESANTLPPHLIEEIEGDFDMYSSDNLWQQGYAAIKQYYSAYQDAI